MENIKNKLIRCFSPENNMVERITLSGKIFVIRDYEVNDYLKQLFEAIEESTLDSDDFPMQVNWVRKSIKECLKELSQGITISIQKWEFDTNNIPSDQFQIYKNTKSFIEAQKTAKRNAPQSQFPVDFYLVDEKYHYSKALNEAPSEIKKALGFVRFFDALEKVADFVDSRTKTSLYFKTSEKNGHLCSISLNENTLFKHSDGGESALPEDVFRLLKDIENLDTKSSLADKEKRFVFSSSIAEFTSKKDEADRFQYLVEHWSEFNELFNNNFKIYTDGKSINELKIALAEEQIKLSDNVTKGIIDILGKILILPSISVVFLVFRQSIQSSDYSIITTIAFAILLIIITLSVWLTSGIHLNIIQSLEYSSKFLNKEAKNDFQNDDELCNLSDHLKKMISNTKILLNTSRWASVALLCVSLAFLTYLCLYPSQNTSSGNKKENALVIEFITPFK